MSIWNINLGNKKTEIPDVLPSGGLLSTYGGEKAIKQYRVWVTDSTGRTFYHAEPDFQRIIIAWRRFQQNLDWYIKIGLPIGVVWDRGINSYREVDLDTMRKWLEYESPEYWSRIKEKAATEAKRKKEEQEKKDLEEKLKKFQAGLTGEKLSEKELGVKKKGKKGAPDVFIAAVDTDIAAQELKSSRQIADELRERAKTFESENKRSKKLEEEVSSSEEVANPKTNVSSLALEAKKKWREDVKAGHGQGEEYWAGYAAAAFLMSNPKFVPGGNVLVMIIGLNEKAISWIIKKGGVAYGGLSVPTLVTSFAKLDEVVKDAAKDGLTFRKKTAPTKGDLTVQKL